MAIKMVPPKRFKRLGIKCNKEFRTTGKYQTLCEECKIHPSSKDYLKQKYLRSKEKLEKDKQEIK